MTLAYVRMWLLTNSLAAWPLIDSTSSEMNSIAQSCEGEQR